MSVKAVKCPQCETKFSYFESKCRPFCSEKCKMVDLGHWFEESYAFEAAPATMEEAEQLADLIAKKNKLQ